MGNSQNLIYPKKEHLHKKIKVRYVDYEQDKIELLSEEVLLERTRQLALKRRGFAAKAKEKKLESYKESVRKVINKKLGPVLKIALHGEDGEGSYIYMDREYYDILIKCRLYKIRGDAQGHDVNGKFISPFTIMGLPKASKYEFIDGDETNFCKNNIKCVGVKTTAYKGVSTTADGTFKVKLKVNNKATYFGAFSNPEFAAKIADVIIRRHYDNVTDDMLNFPDYYNENIKVPGDEGYIHMPIMKSKTGLYGIFKHSNKFTVKLGKFYLGDFDTLDKAKMAATYFAVKSRLYKVDERWLQMPREEYKSKRNDSSYITKEVKEKILNMLNGYKWA